MTILAIDPGSEQSALVAWDGSTISYAAILPNDEVLDDFYGLGSRGVPYDYLVIEEIASYGMPVGREVFQTVRWAGRFEQASEFPVAYLPRREVKLHLCGSSRAKDSNIRQALIDRFGAQGTKKQPGLTYGLRKDLWAAFALAVTFWDLQRQEQSA